MPGEEQTAGVSGGEVQSPSSSRISSSSDDPSAGAPAAAKGDEPYGVAQVVTPSGIETDDYRPLQWAAGIFEGEGSFTHTGRGYLSMVVQMNDESTVRRFAEAVGVGNVGGPYGPYSGNKNPSWRWVANGGDAHRLAESLLPYLSEHRRDQYVEKVGTLKIPKDIQAEQAKKEEPEPFGVSQVVTPSGIEIYFQAGPKRLYRLRKEPETTTPESTWLDVPSMSDVLGILDSPLAWWGMTVGVAGTLELVARGELGFSGDYEPMANSLLVDVEDVVRLLQAHKLTTNDTVKIAQDRGTSVHGALEFWAETGKLAEPSIYPPSEQGHVEGLTQFLIHSGAEPVVSEVMVGSLELGFAGRFDLVADIPNGAEVYVHRTAKGRGDRIEKVPGGRYLLDLKTSKYVYKKHHLQLAGYRLAYAECYAEQVDHMGVIRTLPDGRYLLDQSTSTGDDFWKLKQLYDVIQNTRGR